MSDAQPTRPPRSWQKDTIAQTLIALLSLALLIGVARCVYLAWDVPNGMASIRGWWFDSVFGDVVTTIPPGRRSPADQFAYWESATDRVLQRHPDDPQLMLASALVMERMSDSGIGYVFDARRHQEDIKNLYFRRGIPLTLQRVQTATQRHPANVDGWRVRALMCLDTPVASIVGEQDEGVTREPIRSFRNEAEKHDPDQGIYALIEVAQQLPALLKVDFDSGSSSPFHVDAKDRAKVLLLVEQALNACEKPTLAIGSPALEGLERLLDETGYPERDRLQLLHSYGTSSRMSIKLIQLVRTIFRAANAFHADGEIESSRHLFAAGHTIIDAIVEKGDPQTHNKSVWLEVKHLALDTEASLSAIPAEQIDKQSRLFQVALAKAKHRDATIRLGGYRKRVGSGGIDAIGCLSLSLVAQSLLIFVFAIPAACLAWVTVHKESRPSLAFWPWCVAASAIGFSFLAFGAGPADRLPAGLETATWLIGGAVVAMTAIAGLLANLWGKPQFGLRFLILAITLVAVLLAAANRFAPNSLSVERIGVQSRVNQIQLSTGLPASITMPSSNSSAPEWLMPSLVELQLQNGGRIAVGLTLVLWLLTLFALRKVRRDWGTLVVGITLLGLLLANYMVYRSPALLPPIAKEHQLLSQYLYDPDAYYEPLRKIEASIVYTAAEEDGILDDVRARVEAASAP